MKDAAIGIRGFTRSLGFAFTRGLWWLFLVPLALQFAFVAGLFWISGAVVAWVQAHLQNLLPGPAQHADPTGWARFLDDLQDAASTSGSFVVGLVVRLALFYLFTLISKYVVLIVLSPVLTYASERTEELLTGVRAPFSLGRFAKEVLRGVGMAVRNGTLELALNILLWVLTFMFPPLALIAAPLLWLISSWFYGFSMFDLVFERQGLGIRGSVRAARGVRGMVLANGICLNLLMSLPLLGIVFAPLMGAIGAVLAWHMRPATPAAQGLGTAFRG